MMRCVMPAGFCFICVCALWCQFHFSSQEKPGKDQPNPIEGYWTEVMSDSSGWPERSLPEDRRWGHLPLRWKITKEVIEWGRLDVEGRFSDRCFTYKLNPGGQANAIDIIVWDREVCQGIYFVNGDYLMICSEDYLSNWMMTWGVRRSRPKTFAANVRDHHWRIVILRRGRPIKKDGLFQENGKNFIGLVRELM